jgi:hypothetical protein
MTKISITIETQGLDALQASNLATLLTSIAKNDIAGSPQPETNLEPEQEEKPKATRNRAKKVEAPVEEEPTNIFKKKNEEAKAENVEVVEPETVAPTQEEEADDLMGEEVSEITIEKIRSLVSEKQADHKEAIRAKLKEFDAANVTALPKENYAAFYAFLKGL